MNAKSMCDEVNKHGCHLRQQTGKEAVKGFDHVIASLSPDMRAAFENERRRKQAELDRYVATHGYHT